MNTKDTFTVIPDWVLDQPLDIWETIVFSVIWGFTQDGETVFHGSRAFLARKAKCSTDKVDKCTKKLVALGLIEKRDKYVNGIKFCEYWAKTAGSRYERQVAAGGGEVAAGNGGGSRPHRHNNIDNNADNKLSANRDNSGRASEEDDDPFAWPAPDDDQTPAPAPVPKTATRFTPPTIEDVAAYCRERGNKIDPQHFVDYYSSNGWMVGKNKMKDWRAAVRNWETRDKERNNNGKRNIDPGSPAAYRQVGRNDYYGESTI